MKHIYASDCHSHSDCSFDGESPMREMCKRAAELGLYYYALTDHCECNEYENSANHSSGYRAVVRRAYGEMEECAREFGGRLRFLKGIELGQPLQNLSAAEDALGGGREYDMVIGSLHNIRGEKDFYNLGIENMSSEAADSAVKKYFDEICAMIDWGGFDTLAHITYPLRYLSLSKPGFTGHMEDVERVFSALIKSEKALEMNTSRLMSDGPELPDRELFKLYYDMGGRLVTIGADAHRSNKLAAGIDEGLDILKGAGFSEFTVFVGRKPIMLPLE